MLYVLGLIYLLVARLARLVRLVRQWMKERGIIHIYTLSPRSI